MAKLIAVVSFALLVAAPPADAQYPTKPIHVIRPRAAATSGSLPIGAGPEALDAHIRREIARWDKVLKAAGVQLK